MGGDRVVHGALSPERQLPDRSRLLSRQPRVPGGATAAGPPRWSRVRRVRRRRAEGVVSDVRLHGDALLEPPRAGDRERRVGRRLLAGCDALGAARRATARASARRDVRGHAEVGQELRVPLHDGRASPVAPGVLRAADVRAVSRHRHPPARGRDHGDAGGKPPRLAR